MAPLDPLTVVGVVAIINAVAAAGALLITTWFTARRKYSATRSTDEEIAPPP